MFKLLSGHPYTIDFPVVIESGVEPFFGHNIEDLKAHCRINKVKAVALYCGEEPDPSTDGAPGGMETDFYWYLVTIGKDGKQKSVKAYANVMDLIAPFARTLQAEEMREASFEQRMMPWLYMLAFAYGSGQPLPKSMRL